MLATYISVNHHGLDLVLGTSLYVLTGLLAAAPGGHIMYGPGRHAVALGLLVELAGLAIATALYVWWLIG